MKNLSNKTKSLYLIVLIIFISLTGLFWMDYIGLMNFSSVINKFKTESPSVMETKGDEPSLIAREEFEKEKLRLKERIEALDKREAAISEREKELNEQKEKLAEIKKGIAMEKIKFSNEKKRYSGYKKNVSDLANKISNMPPQSSVKIMINWEDTLIIDVLRKMDADAKELGKQSITSYLITLFPAEKASRILYLMTKL